MEHWIEFDIRGSTLIQFKLFTWMVLEPFSNALNLKEESLGKIVTLKVLEIPPCVQLISRFPENVLISVIGRSVSL